MKLILWVLTTILVLSIVSLLLIEVKRSGYKKSFKYRIEHNYSRYSDEDYTNEYEYVNSNTIRYKDERGDSVVRSGTFSIKINKK